LGHAGEEWWDMCVGHHVETTGKNRERPLSSNLLLVLTGEVMRIIKCYKEYMGLHGRVKSN
jgi:hypothetical protein